MWVVVESAQYVIQAEQLLWVLCDESTEHSQMIIDSIQIELRLTGAGQKKLAPAAACTLAALVLMVPPSYSLRTLVQYHSLELVIRRRNPGLLSPNSSLLIAIACLHVLVPDLLAQLLNEIRRNARTADHPHLPTV